MKEFINKLKTNKKLRIFFIIVMGIVGVFIFYKLVFKGGGSEQAAVYSSGYQGGGVTGYAPTSSSGADTAALGDILQSNNESLSDMLGSYMASSQQFMQYMSEQQSEQNKTILDSIKELLGGNPTNNYLGGSSGAGNIDNSGQTPARNWSNVFDSILTQITAYKQAWNQAYTNKNSSGMNQAKINADAMRDRAINEAISAGYNYQWITTSAGTRELKITGGGNSWQL